MKQSVRIKRELRADKIREICITHRLYTLGNNADYAAMFDHATSLAKKGSWTNQQFEDIVYDTAVDILEHSDTDMPLESIIFYLLNIATLTSVDVF